MTELKKGDGELLTKINLGLGAFQKTERRLLKVVQK
jgi:hypothetical protein